MFLGAYIGFLLSSVLLWYIIVRVTHSEGLDWTDAARWIAGAYLAGFLVRGLGYVLGLPHGLTFVLQMIAGLVVLEWLLHGQYGPQSYRIMLWYVVLRALFAAPWLLAWYLSRK